MQTLKPNLIDSTSLDKPKLLSLIEKFDQVRVLVVGDLILDEYLLAAPERISREAPVIILKYIRSKFALGGAANAAANIAALGAKVSLLGITGDDASAKTLTKLCEEQNVDLINIVDNARQTTTKTRIISTSSSNPDSGTILQQQVLRVDREDSTEISALQQKNILAKFQEAITSSDLVLLSDYDNGILGNNLAQEVLSSARSLKKKTIVDTNGDIYKFKGAYSFTPNQPDTEKALECKINNEAELIEAGLALQTELETEQLLITRGAKGMALFGDKSLDLIPALNLSEVFDVTGAGDTVAALYSVSLALGATPLEAAILGNLAASIVVKKYGTATTSKQELVELIEQL